eukprot:1188950-Amphidinium_carterae.1
MPSAAGAMLRMSGSCTWALQPVDRCLHELRVALLDGEGLMLDCMQVRFGLRTVRTSAAKILLNEAPVQLRGFNRHDMVASPVVSYQDLLREISLLLDIGANFVRGAHYAQDGRFLDLCDIHGIAVWEEVLGWQNNVTDFESSLFMQQQLKLASELAANAINHPSVILAGFFNEGGSD